MSSYSPNPTAAAQPAVTVRRSRRRIGILALLAIGTMINYLDRTVLGIAAPKLTAELGIDPAIMGNPLLRLRLDLCSGADPRRIVSRPLWQQSDLLLSLTLWSLFTLFHGMAVGLKTLLLCRFGLGISEAPCFPVNSRVVSAWFPQQERAKATAVYTVGSISGWPALRRCCSGSWTVSAGGCCSSALAPSAFCLPRCGGAATANRMKIRVLASRSASISKTAAASAPRPTSRWRSAGRWSASC